MQIVKEDPLGAKNKVVSAVKSGARKFASGDTGAVSEVFSALAVAPSGVAALNATAKGLQFTGKAVKEIADQTGEIATRAIENIGRGPLPGSLSAQRGSVGFGNGNGGIPRKIRPEIRGLAEANITDNGITVLGRFRVPPGQINYIQKATVGRYKGSSYFDLGDKWTPLEGKAANQHFLDIIGNRGDKVILSTRKRKIPTGTSLDIEVGYLKDKFDYKWVNQWSLQRR
jgi:hypothetical protein